MLEFFSRLFRGEPSGATAKERLRLVLLSDHLALAPDVVSSLKADLIAVISRYVDVDPGSCDVTFEQQDRSVAMLANIPILGLKTRSGPSNGSGNGPAPRVSVPAGPAFDRTERQSRHLAVAAPIAAEDSELAREAAELPVETGVPPVSATAPTVAEKNSPISREPLALLASEGESAAGDSEPSEPLPEAVVKPPRTRRRRRRAKNAAATSAAPAPG